MVPKDPILRLGFVGTGGVATRHATILSGFDDVALVAATDVDPTRAAAFSEQFGAEAVDDVATLLTRELDAVYVCVPPFAHRPAETSADAQVAAAGLPLFVEKPLATDLATAERLAARIEAAGLLTAVGYHWRYLDTLERARELLADTPARMVLAAWLDKAPRVPWWSRQDESGGQTVEQATHLFDVARVLVGEVVGGAAVGSRSGAAPGDILDVTAAALTFDTGAVGSFSHSCLLPRGQRIGVELVAPGLGLWLTEHRLVVSDADGERTIDRQVDPIEAEDRAFVAAVRGEGDDVRAPYAEALRTHRLVTAVAAAATGDGVVALPEPAGARS
jgi:myo-inositol 2-dehydrogenase / D-chiro-inositol 1-dehydrogenase